MRGVRFGGNVDDADALVVFERPEEFGWLWPSLSGWMFHDAHVVQGYRRVKIVDGVEVEVPLRCPFEKWVEVGAFRFLRERGLQTCAGMMVVESWDPYGDACRDRIRKASDDILAAGGRLDVLYGDSPFTKALAYGNLPGYAWMQMVDGAAVEKRHTVESVVPCVANAVREAHDRGMQFVLVENLGKLPSETLLEAVRRMRDDYGQLIDGFEWDPWPDDLRGAYKTHGPVNEQLHRMGVGQVSGVVCGHGNPDLDSQAEYASSTRKAFGWWQRVPGIDSYTVSSFHTLKGQGDAYQSNAAVRWVPRSLPLSDSTSHLAILRDVLAAQV